MTTTRALIEPLSSAVLTPLPPPPPPPPPPLSQWTEEDEIAVYKKNQEWMDECADGMFEKWYDKIGEEGSMEDRRKVGQSSRRST